MFGGPINPEYSEEFLYPSAFSFIQNFTQVVEDGTIVHLSLAIPLRIIGQGESMYDLVFSAETGRLLVGKVHSVVGYDSTGEPEAAHYVLDC